MKGLVISGDRSGSGKTSITLGIAALLARKYRVQTYKVGMDYIDPSYLTAVAGRPCRNLDGYVMSGGELDRIFLHGAQGAGVALIEGVRGLFEGAESLGDSGSTAEIAKRMDLPVVLVINARSITRSAAAMVRGFMAFDPSIRIRGVILNNIGGRTHREKSVQAVEHYCGIPVIGAIPHDAGIGLTMRHLGLVPYREGQEQDAFRERVERITRIVEEHVDMDQLLSIARDIEIPVTRDPLFAPVLAPDVRVGIAMDEAFTFYYADLFDILPALGAQVIPFSPVHDRLPDADGYVIGGGYPEVFGPALEANQGMREAIRDTSRNAVPLYAECGGLMYLTNSLTIGTGWQGKEHEERSEFCGVFSGTTRIPARRIVSYVEGVARAESPFGAGPFRGHEFHYSDVDLAPETDYAYRLSRGIGIRDGNDGAYRKRTLASYLHLHPVTARKFWEGFVAACRSTAG
ncbi:MAG: Ni-sirohydrochlorin a,c-diamide synthase [Methanomicrobiales archaeon]|nr:Ni-sirohydrochlorin a,c-diamide synthase [Methanomicrobiales archaeon]